MNHDNPHKGKSEHTSSIPSPTTSSCGTVVYFHHPVHSEARTEYSSSEKEQKHSVVAQELPQQSAGPEHGSYRSPGVHLRACSAPPLRRIVYPVVPIYRTLHYCPICMLRPIVRQFSERRDCLSRLAGLLAGLPRYLRRQL